MEASQKPHTSGDAIYIITGESKRLREFSWLQPTVGGTPRRWRRIISPEMRQWKKWKHDDPQEAIFNYCPDCTRGRGALRTAPEGRQDSLNQRWSNCPGGHVPEPPARHVHHHLKPTAALQTKHLPTPGFNHGNLRGKVWFWLWALAKSVSAFTLELYEWEAVSLAVKNTPQRYHNSIWGRTQIHVSLIAWKKLQQFVDTQGCLHIYKWHLKTFS